MTEFDPRRILETFARHGVEYVVVGGLGGALHGSPISTDDVDIVPALKKTNLDALASALNEMNSRILSSKAPEEIQVQFTARDLRKWIVDFRLLSLMTDYGRVDLIHRPGGTGGYQDVAANAEEMDLGGVTIRVAAIEDIIRSKQAVARERDLEQLPTLRMVLEQKQAGTSEAWRQSRAMRPSEIEGVAESSG
jgi:hypothetical protein